MKAVIIEDESLVARELETKIAAVAPDVEIVAKLATLKIAKRWFLENAEPDVLFMDIQLGDGVSFNLLEEFTLKCPVVFTTAYNEYAIKAFKVNGVDYLLKPVSVDELRRAIDKCRQLVARAAAQLPINVQQLLDIFASGGQQKPIYKEKFIINIRQQWTPVNTADVACLVKEAVVYLYTFSGEKHILDYTSMEEIEELLDPNRFYRANRQYIVNIDAIKSIKLLDNQKLTLKMIAPLNTETDVSREKAPAFKKWFDR
ncbi:LytR/AlgR family response regulator transcription factor [Paraflavitalea pollutisoli]|uniref:LytR/AlgR family response regulator transcription factor n=1 Tax=Paraflavitalea pollutisoli TaxID=3034143 RepID=UPI0023EAAAF6|nr:LytTR family DNA-binding domain-containing protein [Paraflavitalea sp. H1-2-19X]